MLYKHALFILVHSFLALINMAVPRHLCPTSEFYRKAQLQQTGGGAGGGEPTQVELLAAGRAALANTERAIYVEKSAFQGAALTVKIQAEEGENDWALFLAVFLSCLEKLIEARVKQNGPSSFWPEIYLPYRKGVEPMELRFIQAYITLPRICGRGEFGYHNWDLFCIAQEYYGS